MKIQLSLADVTACRPGGRVNVCGHAGAFVRMPCLFLTQAAAAVFALVYSLMCAWKIRLFPAHFELLRSSDWSDWLSL